MLGKVDELLVLRRRQIGQLNKQRNAKLNRIIDLEEIYWDPEKRKGYTEAQLHTFHMEKKQLKHDTQILRSSIQAILKDVKVWMVRDKVFSEVQGDVTDHAVVRWMERKHGVDVAALKRDMYSAMAKAAHDGAVIDGGCRGSLKVMDGDDIYVIDPVFGSMVTYWKKGDPEDEDGEEEVMEEVAKGTSRRIVNSTGERR